MVAYSNGTSSPVEGVFYINSTYYLCFRSTTHYTSADGETWTLGTFTFPAAVNSVRSFTQVGNQLIALCRNSSNQQVIAYTSDGSAWSAHDTMDFTGADNIAGSPEGDSYVVTRNNGVTRSNALDSGWEEATTDLLRVKLDPDSLGLGEEGIDAFFDDLETFFESENRYPTAHLINAMTPDNYQGDFEIFSIDKTEKTNKSMP